MDRGEGQRDAEAARLTDDDQRASEKAETMPDPQAQFEIPGVAGVILACVMLALAGRWLDKSLMTPNLEAWRAQVRQVWQRFRTSGAEVLAADANSLFIGFFDTIYGRRFWTGRRIIMSAISTTVAMGIITLILGYENTAWPELADLISESPEELWYFPIMIVFFFNYIPDFFSLAETRVVLWLSRKCGALGIIALLFLDLMLTASIFWIGVSFYFTIAPLLLKGGEFGLVELFVRMTENQFWLKYAEIVFRSDLEFIEQILLTPGIGLLFFLTTFVTSLIWISFVITYAVIRSLDMMTPVARVFYDQVLLSGRPASTISLIFIVMILLAYTTVIVALNLWA